MTQGIIFDIKEFTVHDGPGIRTTVFLKGCPLRCVWCHNPEGISFQPELMVRRTLCIHCGKCEQGCAHPECAPFDLCAKICPQGLIHVAGQVTDSMELAAKLSKYEAFLQKNNGGITFSGGEPLAQPDFLIALLQEMRARPKPLHTVVETSGYGSPDCFKKVVELADLILFDIKHADPEIHQKYTGVDNRLILNNLNYLIGTGKSFRARIPLIPGINDTEDNMGKIAMLLGKASGLEKVEFLPYNPLAGAKYPMVAQEYQPPFDEKQPIQVLTQVFEKQGIPFIVL